MANQDADRSMVDSATRDIGNAVKMGKDTARAAKTISKAASQAASGNFVGAGISLLKDPETMKKLIVLILIPAIALSAITVMFLYALPIAIFESIMTYIAQLKTMYNEALYSGTGSIVMRDINATLKVGGQIVSDVAKVLWNGVKALFGTRADQPDEETPGAEFDGNDTELHVTQEEAAERGALLRKIDLCIEKISAREEQISKAIWQKRRAIVKAVTEAKGVGFDEFEVRVNITAIPIAQTEAIQLLSLYTVQKGASLQDMAVADMLQYLGWQPAFAGMTSFEISDYNVEAKVKKWTGTFMPQYLEEQRKQLKEREIDTVFMERQGAAATDFLLYVSAPRMNDIQILAEYLTREEEVIDPETGEPTGEIIEIKYVKGLAIVNIDIRSRPISRLSRLAGLWSDALPKSETDIEGEGLMIDDAA